MPIVHRAANRTACFTTVLTLSALMLMSCGKSSSGGGSNYTPDGPGTQFPFLGDSTKFAVLAKKAFNNTGSSVVYGDIGVSQGGTLNGTSSIKRTGGDMHAADAQAVQAQGDATTAFNNINGKACEHDLTGQDLGNLTLTPGTYCFNGDATLKTGSSILTLDFAGDPKANFVFQVNGNLLAGNNAAVVIKNSGEDCKVFWAVAGSVDFAPFTNFKGGIISVGDITMNDHSSLNGKAMSRSGSVNLNSGEIYNNFCK